MSDPLSQALASLQSPQETSPSSGGNAARNSSIINQFNHANAYNRIAKSHAKMIAPDYSALIQKLHGIDALLMQGQMADKSRFRPDILKLAETAQLTGKNNLAYNILNEENRRILSRDAIGGQPLSTMAWEKLRHEAGLDAIRHHGTEESRDSGPVQMPGGVARQQEMTAAYASPNAKDDLYRIGIDSFDRTFGKHKHYLVQDDLSPNLGAAPQQNNVSPRNQSTGAPLPSAPGLPPGLESIIHNAGIIGDQQRQGAPAISPEQFSQQLGIES